MAAVQGPLQYREAGFTGVPVIDHYLSPLALWSAQWVPSAWVTRLDAANSTAFDVPADVSSVHGRVVTAQAAVAPIAYPSGDVRPFYVAWNVVFGFGMLAMLFWFYTELVSMSRTREVRRKSKRVPTTLAVQ